MTYRDIKALRCIMLGLVLGAFGTPQALAQNSLAQTPVYALDFDEAQGLTQSGELLLANGVGTAEGRFGNALAFDGNGQRADIAVGAPKPEATVAFWFKADADNSGLFSFARAITKSGVPSRASDIAIYLRDGHVVVQSSIDAEARTAESIRSDRGGYADGGWHHLAVVRGGEAGVQRLYIDGVEVARGEATDFRPRPTAVAVLGFAHPAKTDGKRSSRKDGNRYMTGRIDGFRLFDEALDADAIRALETDYPTVSVAYPDDARVIDVTQHGIDNTGQTDVSGALQALVETYQNKQFGRWTLYFPDGTYRVTQPIVSERWLPIQGESREGTVLKLDDGAALYADAATPAPVLQMGRTINESFGVFLHDITVDAGAGNPGAIGVDFQAHNVGAIRNVRIVSGEGSGHTGLMLKRRDERNRELTPGPHLVKGLEVEGFDTGIVLGEAQSGILHVTFEDIDLRGQSVAGMAFTPRLNASIRNMRSVNDVPAVTAGGGFGAAFSILDSEFTTLSDASARSALEFANNRNRVYLDSVSTQGYANGLTIGTRPVPQSDFSDWTSHAPESLFESPATSIGLAVAETPVYNNINTATDWEPVTYSFQAAVDSGKPVVYLPNRGGAEFNVFNGITDTVTVHSSVRKIDFMHQAVGSNSWAGGANPVFEIGGTSEDPPLIIENVEFQNQSQFEGPFFLHTGSRTVVLKSAKGRYVAAPGAGDVFFEDYVGADLVFQPGQKVWARQFNLEDATGGPRPLALNTGADMWILGLKTEGAKTAVRTEAGGRTEVHGGVFLPLQQGSVADIPLWEIEDGSFSASGYTAFFTYPIHARETRDGETRDLNKSGRASISLFTSGE